MIEQIERILWALLWMLDNYWPADARTEREKSIVNSFNHARNMLQQYINDRERGLL